jgi:hypothetical protein
MGGRAWKSAGTSYRPQPRSERFDIHDHWKSIACVSLKIDRVLPGAAERLQLGLHVPRRQDIFRKFQRFFVLDRNVRRGLRKRVTSQHWFNIFLGGIGDVRIDSGPRIASMGFDRVPDRACIASALEPDRVDCDCLRFLKKNTGENEAGTGTEVQTQEGLPVPDRCPGLANDTATNFLCPGNEWVEHQVDERKGAIPFKFAESRQDVQCRPKRIYDAATEKCADWQTFDILYRLFDGCRVEFEYSHFNLFGRAMPPRMLTNNPTNFHANRSTWKPAAGVVTISADSSPRRPREAAIPEAGVGWHGGSRFRGDGSGVSLE